MCKNSANQWYIAGITSFGMKKCGSRGHTGVYVPLHNFNKWLRGTIEKDSMGLC